MTKNSYFKIGNIMALALMAESFDQSFLIDDNKGKNKLSTKDINTTPKEKPVPKGCQRYYYNENGICCKSESKVYFDAMKPSKAREKFERWLSN